MDHRLLILAFVPFPMDTLVDPSELAPLSSGRLKAAPPLPPPPPRGTMPSFEPDGTLWFERVRADAELPAVDIEVALEEDTDPTLVLPRPRIL